MQAIPEDAIPEESGDEEEDDPDKRISSKIQILGTFDLPPAFLRLCSALLLSHPPQNTSSVGAN